MVKVFIFPSNRPNNILPVRSVLCCFQEHLSLTTTKTHLGFDNNVLDLIQPKFLEY